MGAIEDLRRTLEEAGLGALAQGIWAMHQQNASDEAIYDWMLEQPDYQRNFSGLVALRQKGKAAGIKEGEYLQLRQGMSAVLQRAGLSRSGFDTPEYLNRVIGEEVSLDEFTNRVAMAQAAASTMPQEVQDELRNRYGITSDNVLAYYLDTDAVEADLVNQQQAAMLAASYARYQSPPIRTDVFEEVARQVDERNANEALNSLGTLGTGLSDQERILGAFGLSPAMARERRTRAASFQGGGNAAAQAEGVTGLASSSS